MKLESCAILAMLVSLTGCAASTTKPPNYADMLKDQTLSYSNEAGAVAHRVWCRDTGTCLVLAGMLCPDGYDKSDEQTVNRKGWSFSASRFVGEGNWQDSITSLNVVCKSSFRTYINPIVDKVESIGTEIKDAIQRP